jgi:hypothetical protein
MRKRTLLPALLVAALTARAGDDITVRNESSNFEISLPPEKAGDWDKIEDKDRADVKAHFRTEFTDTEPLATAEVQVIVHSNDRTLQGRKLESIAAQWASSMEGSLENPREQGESETTLGGQPAYMRDLKGDLVKGSGVGHVTWYLTRMGKFLYVVHVIRTYRAVGDAELEGEIKQIVDSFKFLKVEEVKADPKAKPGEGPAAPAGAGASEKPKGPDPELLKREDKKIDFWKLKFVKPEGLLEIPVEKFEKSETDNNCIAKFTATGEQTYILFRVYAQREKTQQFTIEQLADRNLASFKQTYDEKSRMPEEIDKDYKKFPLAKDAIHMKLTGRRTVPEIKHWYLAQCKNGCQYEIEIYMTGAEGEKAWKNQIDAFMKGFRPYED